jgi:hypothetical protein
MITIRKRTYQYIDQQIINVNLNNQKVCIIAYLRFHIIVYNPGNNQQYEDKSGDLD